LTQLLYEFVEQNGSYLVFFREEGIQREELHALQVRMLRQYDIERLLPIAFDESDFVIKLRYAISETKMLSQVLQYRRLLMSEYYEILLKTVLMLLDCKQYMLDEDKHILHENFIFVGADITDVRFVYLPTENVGLTGSVPERLKQLALTLIAFVDGMDAAGLQSILQYFYTETFTLAGFRELLHRLELQTGQRSEEQDAPARMHLVQEAKARPVEVQTERQTELKPAKQAVREETSGPEKDDEAGPADPFLRALAIKPGAGKQTDKGKKVKQESKQAADPVQQHEAGKRNKLLKQMDAKKELQLRNIAFAALAVGLALTLKDVLEKGADGWLSPFLLLVLLAVVLLIRHLLLKPKSSPGATGGTAPPTEQLSDKQQSKEMQPTEPERRHATEREPVQIVGPEVPTEHYYEALPLYTRMLGESTSPVTAHLGFDNSSHQEEEQALSYLIVQRSGHMERIAIHKDVFRIGSQADAVHYEEQADGVSRTHVEVMKKSGKNVVRDLGSRNGTFLNGVKLAPYREYMLNDEDRLLIGPSEFQFFYTLKGSADSYVTEAVLAAAVDRSGGQHEIME